MARFSFKINLKEYPAHMRQNQGIVGRLAVDNAVGFQTAHYRLDRAIASAFLVTHGGNCHIARQLIPGILQKLYRHHRCHQTALHIRAAASVHLAIPNYRLKRRVRPAVFHLRRHNVNMTVK